MKIDCLFWTKSAADPAAFTFAGIDHEIVADRRKAAQLSAQAAAAAVLGYNGRFTAADEIVRLHDARSEQQMQIGSIDIGVAEQMILRQRSEGPAETQATGGAPPAMGVNVTADRSCQAARASCRARARQSGKADDPI